MLLGLVLTEANGRNALFSLSAARMQDQFLNKIKKIRQKTGNPRSAPDSALGPDISLDLLVLAN